MVVEFLNIGLSGAYLRANGRWDMPRGCTVIAAEAAIQESPGVARPATAIPTVMFEPAEARQSYILDTGLRRYDGLG